MAADAAKALQDEPVLLRQDEDQIAFLTLNRPNQFNALSEELLTALKNELQAIAEDEAVRVVVIEGAGRAFCPGHDLKQMRANPDLEYYRRLFTLCCEMMQTVTALPQPVIAKVHGIATAAGCQLVATCDLAVASNDARFATSGINAGLFCSTPSVALTRNVAAKPAFEMLFTGDFITAQQAQELNLINRAVPADELDKAVRELAGKIIAKSAVTIRMGKQLFYKQLETTRAEAYKLAAETMACNMMSEDAGEGFDAFIEKRKPEWKHR